MSLGRAAIFSPSTKARNEQSRLISSPGKKTGELERSSVEGMDGCMQMDLIMACVSSTFLKIINLIKG